MLLGRPQNPQHRRRKNHIHDVNSVACALP